VVPKNETSEITTVIPRGPAAKHLKIKHEKTTTVAPRGPAAKHLKIKHEKPPLWLLAALPRNM
jgi:hypothetical protein